MIMKYLFISMNILLEYIKNLNEKNDLKHLYEKIISYDNMHVIPAVRYESALLLNLLASLKNPSITLEIGFGSGASSVFISNGIRSGRIISLERDKNRFKRGLKLLSELNINNIELLNIDAFDFFPKNNKSFDFIFLDSVKREYINYIQPVKQIMNNDGLLVCDNILFNGKIVDLQPEKKYKNGIELLREFNKTLSEDHEFETLFLPIDDGLSLSRYKKRNL